jgi:outer membrane lipoprotein-sorting protein
MAVVVLTLRPPAFSIEAAELIDEAGNRTSYVFSGIRRNRGVPEGAFAFEPPPGTEVVDEP